MSVNILSVNFEPDAVVFQFTKDDAIREPGLILTQQLRVPATAEFDHLLADLDTVAERVLSECLNEFEGAPRYGTEEEAPSPFDNPEER